ncbi:MAG TPA: lysylphosphatidylglycerol synthase transmembrane domain-containing protein [Candidatus Limnocylindrales bacterium]|nr:lysylphosphatidylglycerol synthase transmembrane domain-containing protein [Candidatus Limnocylindrales bacterium]
MSEPLPPAGQPGPGAGTAGADGADGSGDEVSREQLSLGHRLRQPRTIISLALPLVLLVLLARALPGFQLEQLPARILAADPLLLLAAFAVYYLGFPLRGYRWSILLRETGARISTRDSTEIIFISWLVNCLVPAKLGDVYRAWLLRLNFAVSLSRTVGTVFMERVFDLFAIVVLGVAAGFWSFRSGLPLYVQFIFGVGVAVVVGLVVGLFTLRNFGRRIVERLPLPHRLLEFYDRFEEGVFSVAYRDVPRLALVTALIWTTEAARLFLVVAALGMSDVHLGISGAFFVALAASLLTAVPLTPAGIGVVEAGIVGILTVIYGVAPTEAASIALVDRAISVLSIIVLGAIAYVISPKTKGSGPPKAVASEGV